MSFRCEQCNEAQPVKAKPNMVVAEWYPGQGDTRQIKREKKLCDKCAGKMMKPIVSSMSASVDPITVKLEIPG